jgi:hypothetical protein
MPYVIKVEDGYVKSGKNDTNDINKAKTFDTKQQAKNFADRNLGGSIKHEIVEKEES